MTEPISREELRRKKAEQRAALNMAKAEERDANVAQQMQDAEGIGDIIPKPVVAEAPVQGKVDKHQSRVKTKQEKASQETVQPDKKKTDVPAKKNKVQIYMEDRFLEKLEAETGKFGDKKEVSMSDLGGVGIEAVLGLTLTEYRKLKKIANEKNKHMAECIVDAVKKYIKEE